MTTHLRPLLLGFLSLLATGLLRAHPLPNTVVKLDVLPSGIVMTLQLPLQDFEIAYKKPFPLSTAYDDKVAAYFFRHIQLTNSRHQPWRIEWMDWRVQTAKAAIVGPYQELQVRLRLMPPSPADRRDFTLHYDLIMHEITNHQALVFVQSDWENGIHGCEQIGVIGIDIPSNTLLPLHVALEKGSQWKGFKSMVHLGMAHIAEGTDHLLFLLVLLLTAPLIAQNQKWKPVKGYRHGLLRILKITGAFTLGHSLTLAVGALGRMTVNPQGIELLIALSILITAIHALTPLFPKRETYIAAGFGLIHGLAFSSVLGQLHVDTRQLVLSLFGFNLGIEIMQLMVVALVVPWLLLLARFPVYARIRQLGGLFAIVAAVGWAFERYTEQSNRLSEAIAQAAQHAVWVVVVLATLALYYTLTQKPPSRYR